MGSLAPASPHHGDRCASTLPSHPRAATSRAASPVSRREHPSTPEQTVSEYRGCRLFPRRDPTGFRLRAHRAAAPRPLRALRGLRGWFGGFGRTPAVREGFPRRANGPRLPVWAPSLARSNEEPCVTGTGGGWGGSPGQRRWRGADGTKARSFPTPCGLRRGTELPWGAGRLLLGSKARRAALLLPGSVGAGVVP